ncbi:MAG: endonuclease/exonuclease/phosphatase family protein, partial [Xanthomonadales bacterium]|nr:endonuclease/exonuclease/phosphatase family protein [Xanthomonadales bacterium]
MGEHKNNDARPQRLKLLSFNIQAGTSITRYHEYVLHSWRHVLPHSQRMSNLDAIAKLIGEYDIVALQEVDAGSLRSGFVNQTRYLASHAGLPFWCQQSNRKVGRVAYAANGLVSRYQPDAVEEHRLPGTIPGRGALMTRFGEGEDALILVSVHLALGRRARAQQLDYLAGELEGRRNLVVMGDLNTQVTSPELKQFLR